MQLLRAIVILAALAAAAGQYVQEMRRMSAIARLPVAEAMQRYERTRLRTERMLTFLSLGLAVLAMVALLYVFGFPRKGG